MILKVSNHIKKWLEDNDCWDKWLSNIKLAINDDEYYIRTECTKNEKITLIYKMN